MKIGLQHTLHLVVEHSHTATHYGSGQVEVYATPAMVALMENAALRAVQGQLPEGHTTVGTEICVTHTKASPLGMKVFAQAELVGVDGRKLMFKVRAWDQEGEIGSGTHTRFIVDRKRFIEKIKK